MKTAYKCIVLITVWINRSKEFIIKDKLDLNQDFTVLYTKLFIGIIINVKIIRHWWEIKQQWPH